MKFELSTKQKYTSGLTMGIATLTRRTGDLGGISCCCTSGLK